MGEQNDVNPKPQENDGGEEFTFIKEKIKDKPINKRKLATKVFVTIFLAVLFGLISGAVYLVSIHYLNDIIYPKQKEIVKLSSDEENANVSANQTPSVNEVKEEEEQTEHVINNIVEKVEMSVEDYEGLSVLLHNIALDAQKSLVYVTGVSSDMDWFQNTYENTNQEAGMIVAQNGKQLLILVNKSVTENAQTISVKYVDGTTTEANLKKYDANTGLAIIGVDLEDISEETMREITSVKLGSTATSNLVGKDVIAVGSPLGTEDSVAYGRITSDSDTRQMIDTDMQLITTDIYGSKNASGMIINLKGEVLGIITRNYASTETENLISTIAISDLKESIEKLSNGQDRALLGIYGTDVTEKAMEELGIPAGAYVTEIVMDSPAMEAGIQSGDVITKIGTTEILNFSDYKSAMSKSQPGDTAVVTVMRFAKGEYTEMSFELILDKLQ